MVQQSKRTLTIALTHGTFHNSLKNAEVIPMCKKEAMNITAGLSVYFPIFLKLVRDL